MLEITWFLLWVLLWSIYLMLDGFDFGASILAPFIARTPEEKEDAYLAVGPFWDGNEVWLIAAGGITFAAFPKAYAILFSAMYAPLLLFLFVLIFRAAAIEFQLHMTNIIWKRVWGKIYWGANILAPILLGVFFSNLFTGIPIDGKGVYHGSLLQLFTPYTCVAAILFLTLFCMHGGLWLILKTNGALKARTIKFVRIAWPSTCALLVLFIWMSSFSTSVFDVYTKNLKLITIPILLMLGILGTGLFFKKGAFLRAWVFSAASIIIFIFCGMIGVFPNIITSSLSPDFSLTIFEAASSPLTLKIMLAVAFIFVPMVIAYQLWAHYLFFKPKEISS